MRPREQISRGAEALSLPAQVFGQGSMEICGYTTLLISGQKGIRSYAETEIVVELRDYAVRVRGTGLGMVSMTADELLIRGELQTVEFLR